MREIEKKMCVAIACGHNMRSGNTAVINDESGTKVYLHGHNIWTRDNNGVESFSLCGWNTNTTRSRLNAIGVNVCQRNFIPLYNGREIDAYKRYFVER